MLEYIIQTTIDGVKIDLIKTFDAYTVLYGIDREAFPTISQAVEHYDGCVRHAMSCGGHLDD